MFFHLSIKHYAPALTRFWLGFGACKKEAYLMASDMAFLRRNIVMFAVVKFCGVGDWIWVKGIFSTHLDS